MTISLNGLGVSRGVAIGKAHILQRNQLEIRERPIAPSEIRREKARFRRAVRIAKNQLKAIRGQIPAGTPDDIASFIDTHLLMLEDAMVSRAPAQIIQERRCNAEWALQLQRDALVQIFEAMEDPYLRTRKDDVEHVVIRIQRILMEGDKPQSELAGQSLQGCIILAHDLTPADTILMQHQGIAGFVTEHGGPMSHTAILARSLQIPALVGVSQVLIHLQDEELLILDGEEGVIHAAPDNLVIKYYRKRKREQRKARKLLESLIDKAAVTLDDRTITLQANIEMPEDFKTVKKVAADGVGLYRTEFLYLNRPDLPSEEEQLKVYRRVIRILKGAPLTIRTLDLGADKQNEQRTGYDSAPTNPALGLRAIRLCLKDVELFRTQLRAILRASAFGPIRLLIPMISNLNEVILVKKKITDIKTELAKEGCRYDDNIPLGAIVEIPAAAISADMLAKQVDFLSIGTNDLIQYTLAIDRVDEEVNYLYDPLHPAVLKLIQMTIKAGRKAKIPVAMCGEMAGDPTLTRLLLGLGLTEFSMHPSSLLEVKQVITSSSMNDSAKLAKRIVGSSRSKRTQLLLKKLNSQTHESQ